MRLKINTFYERLGSIFENKKDLHEILNTKDLKKDEVFLNYGQRQAELAILVDGKLISKYEYEFDNKYDSKEYVSKIFYAHKENQDDMTFIVNHESYFFNKVSTEAIQAIENSTIVTIKKEDIEKIVKTDPEFEKMFLDFQSSSFLVLNERLRDLQSLSTEHKIKKFSKQNPELINLKVDYLIQYLGIRSKDTYYRVLRKLRK